MRAGTLAAWAALMVLVLAPAQAQGTDTATLEATGVLVADTLTVSVDPALAVLSLDPEATTTADALRFPAGRTGPQPVGRIVWVGPPAGSEVASGQVLARIDPTRGRLLRRRARAEAFTAQARVAALLDGLTDLVDARGELAEKRDELLAARRRARCKSEAAERRLRGELADLGMAAQALKLERRELAAQLASVKDPQERAGLEGALAEVEIKLAKLAEAEGGLKAARVEGARAFEAALSRIEEGLDRIDRALEELRDRERVLRHRIEAAKALREREIALYELAGLLAATRTIRAPVAGRLASLDVEDGGLAFAGQPVAKVAHQARLLLEVFLSAQEAADAARSLVPGRAAQVTADGVPGVFEGRVLRLGGLVVPAPTEAVSTETHLMRALRVELEVRDPSGALKAGMPADARIFMGRGEKG